MDFIHERLERLERDSHAPQPIVTAEEFAAFRGEMLTRLADVESFVKWARNQ